MNEDHKQIYLNTDKASETLQISKKTMANWRSLNKGPKYLKRGKIFYRLHDLDEWMNEGLVETETE